jgi:hypothetical protein
VYVVFSYGFLLNAVVIIVRSSSVPSLQHLSSYTLHQNTTQLIMPLTRLIFHMTKDSYLTLLPALPAVVVEIVRLLPPGP